MNRLRELLATFFFLGYSPWASGTVGSLGALLLAWLLLPVPAMLNLGILSSYGVLSGVLALLFLALGVPLGHWAEKRYGRKDPGPFVLDEVAGFFVPFCFFLHERPAWDEMLAAFFLFRLFDVVKPPPARRLERLRGGWGIMLDDVVAGLYALMGLVVYHAVRSNPVF